MVLTSDEALVGRVLNDRYLMAGRIARGGMASVFLATDLRLDREVAIKVMHQGLGDDEEFTNRFVREAKSAAKLNHRNVVSVFDQGTDGEVTYLVMEYVPGRTLRDLMREEAPMPPYRALELVEQVLIALSAAHAAKIIHRDVKPENVLISPDGDVKVADFGLARAVSAATTATGGTLIGTVSYLAPEIVTNDGADARSDVYACGALLYEMLTGVKPHSGESPIQVAYKHVHEDIGAPSEVQPGIPPYVDALVARATVRDRDQRSTDARVMLQQLRSVQRALDAGLDDDPDLVADLLPGGRGSDAVWEAPTVATPRAAFAASAADSAPTESVPSTEHTMQWEAGLAGPALAVSDRATKPTGLHPPMSRDEYGQAAAGSRSRRGRLMLIAAILFALLAGSLTWYFTELRYESAPVLIGSSEAVAKAAAEEQGYTFEVEKRAFSEDDPMGTVISTDPKAGGKILPGGTIKAVISKGPDRVFIPKGNLSGMTVEEATAALEEQDLVLGKQTEKFDEKIPEGNVISADGVTFEDELKRGDVIDILVSKGRQPLSIEDFTGKPASDAKTALEKSGFKVAIKQQFSDDIGEGVVIAQDPREGEGFRNDTITLTVSKGPELIPVPNVIDQRKNDATDILEAAGFKVREFGSGNFVVRSQSPGEGAKRKKGDTITITSVSFP